MKAIKENLYQLVKTLQGPKHPHYNYEALNQCADTIAGYLMNYGLNVKEQVFYVKGDLRPYRNLFAYWGDLKPSMTIIGSHYDTVPNTPAANDNLSAVAVSIELARILALQENKPNVGFAFFTLEEGHPGFFEHKHKLLVEHNLIEENGEFSSALLLELSKELQRFLKRQDRKNPYPDNLEAFLKQREFYSDESLYLSILLDSYREYAIDSPEGRATYPVGSHHFVDEFLPYIGRAIVMDCVGWVGNHIKNHSPMPLHGLEPYLSAYQATADQTTGNYLTFTGSLNTHPWLNELHLHCSSSGVDFPHIALNLPMPYEIIKQMAPDTLRSDHAAFWRKNIPAIFISDTANFRSNLYHTASDTLEHLNFEFLTLFVHSLYHFIEN